MTEDGTRIGYVVSVSGSKLSGILVKNEGTEDPGDLARLADAVQVGALVKVATPRSMVFGMVSDLTIRQPSSPPQVQDGRLIEIDLFGEAGQISSFVGFVVGLIAVRHFRG